MLETSRHGLLETELLELLADENNLTPPQYKPGEDEPTKTETSTQATGMSDATEALADKLQEQVNIAYVQTEESKDEQKKKDGETGKWLHLVYCILHSVVTRWMSFSGYVVVAGVLLS